MLKPSDKKHDRQIHRSYYFCISSFEAPSRCTHDLSARQYLYIGAEPRPRHGILSTRKITIEIRMKLNLKMNIIIKINIKRQ